MIRMHRRDRTLANGKVIHTVRWRENGRSKEKSFPTAAEADAFAAGEDVDIARARYFDKELVADLTWGQLRTLIQDAVREALTAGSG